MLDQVKSELLDLKEKALQATQRSDGDFYKEYLSDGAIAVAPFGVFGKNEIVKQMSSSGDALKDALIEDTKTMVISPDCGIVTYKATFGEGKNSHALFVTTVYAKVNGQWKGVFYQQTPLQTAH